MGRPCLHISIHTVKMSRNCPLHIGNCRLKMYKYKLYRHILAYIVYYII